jgi:hypothetical protein
MRLGLVTRQFVWIAVVLLVAGCGRKSEFTIHSVDEAKALGNYQDWTFVDVVGDQTGPYKSLGALAFPRRPTGSPPIQGTYRMNGQKVFHEVKGAGPFLLARFENPCGNLLVIVFTKPEDSDGDSGTEH